jgi:hypothetical protein
VRTEEIRRLVIKILQKREMPQVELKRLVMERAGDERPTDRRLRKILQKMDRDHLIVRVPKKGSYELHLPLKKEVKEEVKEEEKEKEKEEIEEEPKYAEFDPLSLYQRVYPL